MDGKINNKNCSVSSTSREIHIKIMKYYSVHVRMAKIKTQQKNRAIIPTTKCGPIRNDFKILKRS